MIVALIPTDKPDELLEKAVTFAEELTKEVDFVVLGEVIGLLLTGDLM